MDERELSELRRAIHVQARAAAKRAIVAQANARAQASLPIIGELRAAGVRSYRGIAAKLNERGVPTARAAAGRRRRSATSLCVRPFRLQISDKTQVAASQRSVKPRSILNGLLNSQGAEWRRCLLPDQRSLASS